MNNQERAIISLLLNEMAFEGALKHFHEPIPAISEDFLKQIAAIEPPKRYDRNSASYELVNVEFAPDVSTFEQCFAYLRIIRNNIIHANKAHRPDTPERLTELLDWAASFITSVYDANTSFANRAREIKAVLMIESF